MRRYIQAKMKFSDFCDVQTNIVEYFVENIIYMYFPLFSVLLSNLSITECIFNIIVTSFKYRQFLYQLHIWYCMLPPPPPPSGINFCILWYKLILPCLSTLTDGLLSIQILKKSWRGMSKDKFYMFSVSNRCQMGYRQIPVNRNLIQIHAQILNFISSNSSCTDRHTWSIHPASQLSVHFSFHVSIVSKWNISTLMCIGSNPPPHLFHAITKIA